MTLINQINNLFATRTVNPHNSQFTLNLSMSNELTDTMELDSNTFGTDNSRETVFTRSI